MSAAEHRTLVLLRHAKSESGGYDNDHERSLTARGDRDAVEAGRWLHEHDIGIDEVLCSSALRAQQTAEGVWAGGCAETDVRLERRVYNASPEAILDVVHDADPDADVVMVVGHAPGIPALASMLADGEGSGEAHEALSRGYPTCGVAVLRYGGRWDDLAPGEAYLERFHVCRGADKER